MRQNVGRAEVKKTINISIVSIQDVVPVEQTVLPLPTDPTMDIANRSPQVQAVAVVFLTLSWVAVGLRCASRLIKKLFRTEDWLALAALVRLAPFRSPHLPGLMVNRRPSPSSAPSLSTA